MGDMGQYRCHQPLEEMKREAPSCAALGLAAEPTLGFLPAENKGGETPWGGDLGAPPAHSSSLCPPAGCWDRSAVEGPWRDPILLPLLPSWDIPGYPSTMRGATSWCSPGISRALQLRGEQPSVQGQEEMPE